MIILFILSAKLTVYSQVEETRKVKISVLTEIFKDLEKCKLTEETYQMTSFNFDNVLKINVRLFDDLEKKQAEKKELELSLKDLNKEYNKVLKKKKTSWIVPGVGGTIIGIAAMLFL